jgi:hypothetical protein
MPFQAKVNGFCAICDEIILSGSVTTPIRLVSTSTSSDSLTVSSLPSKQKSKPPIQWFHPHSLLIFSNLFRAHKDCILDKNDERIPVCKHWGTKGICIFHEKCQFRHPPQEKKSNTDPSTKSSRHGTWGRKRIYNEGRASALRRWVLKTFDINDLTSRGILDIAGGKGEISFEFLNLNEIPCTVIDPRPLDLFRFKRKLEYGFYHRNEVLACYNRRLGPVTNGAVAAIDDSSGGTTLDDKGEVMGGEGTEVDHHSRKRIPRLPHHIRGYFEMFDSMKTGSPLERNIERSECKDLDRLPIALRSPEEFDFQLERSRQTKWTKKGLQHEDEVEEEGDSDDEEQDGDSVAPASMSAESSSCQSNLRLREMEGGIEITSYAEACDLVKNCAMVVGMHSDQVPPSPPPHTFSFPAIESGFLTSLP